MSLSNTQVPPPEARIPAAGSAAPSVYFADNEAKEGLGRQSLRSGAISVFAQGMNIVIQVGSTIFLARLLLPEDFGLVAMISAITGFASVLMDLGTRDAAIQKSRITQDEISALFWLTVGIGGSLAAATAFCGPLIADFYHESQLARIAQVWALIFVLHALSYQHGALLRRALMFQKIAIIEITANVFGAGGAVAMALAGSGYWALVFRPIFTAFFTVAGVWFSCRWVPGIPSFSQGVKEMLKFGIHITGFTLTDYLGRAADRVGLGYTSGAKELGYYHNASMVYDLPLGIFTVPLHTVAVASLSRLRDNLDELRRSWSTALSSVTFFAMPAFVSLAVTGPDFVVLLLGEKWFYAGTILSVLALRGPAHVVERTLGWLHVAAGRPDRWMRWGVVSSLLQVIALFVGLPFGTMGVAISYTVCTYVLFVPAIVYAGRPLGIGLSHLARVVGPQLVGALCAALSGFGLRLTYLADTPWMARITVLMLACTMSYLLVTVGVFRVTRPLQVATSLFVDFVLIPFSRVLRVEFVRPNGKTQ